MSSLSPSLGDTSSFPSTSTLSGSSKPHTFAVPAIPRHSRHIRPLSMSTVHNITPLSNTMENDNGQSGTGKTGLKRLSLISRPAKYHAEVEPLATPGTPGTPGTPSSARRRAVGMRSSISYSPAITSNSSTRPLGQKLEEEGGFERWKMERGMSEEVVTAGPSRSNTNRRRSTALILEQQGSIEEDGQNELEEAGRRTSEDKGKAEGKHRRGETMVEKHADLLTLIAQKERRVNDLRQELAAQEASLTQLKGRWTAIVSRSAPTASPRINSTRSSRGHPLSGGSRSGQGIARPTPIESALQALTSSTPLATSTATPSTTDQESSALGPSMSTSTSASSHLSSLPTPVDDVLDPTLTFDGELALTPRDNQSLAAFLQTLSLNTTPESLLGQETIEGGKRFWSQLVKTVSAAAGGTVPDPEGGEGHETGEGALSPRLDISALKSILPTWTTIPSQPAPPAPPQPANASRLPGKKSKRSKTSLRASTSPRAARPGAKEDAADDAIGVITPSSSVGSGTSGTSGMSLSRGTGIDLLGDDGDVSPEGRMGDLEAPLLKPSKSAERTSPKAGQGVKANEEEEDDYDWGW